MRDTILLFGFEKERQRKLTRAFMPLKLRIKPVEEQDFDKPIGYLAGNTLQPLEEEMILMAGLNSGRMDQVLAAIRKSGVGPIPYKAVLTSTNQHWTAKELLAELMREHAKMQTNLTGVEQTENQRERE